MELIKWRSDIFSNVLQLYGHLILNMGFWQADPHGGNFIWDDRQNVLWLIDWGAVGDFSATATGKRFQRGLNNFYKKMRDYIQMKRMCEGFQVTLSTKAGRVAQNFVHSGSTTDLLSRQGSRVYHATTVG